MWWWQNMLVVHITAHNFLSICPFVLKYILYIFIVFSSLKLWFCLKSCILLLSWQVLNFVDPWSRSLLSREITAKITFAVKSVRSLHQLQMCKRIMADNSITHTARLMSSDCNRCDTHATKVTLIGVRLRNVHVACLIPVSRATAPSLCPLSCAKSAAANVLILHWRQTSLIVAASKSMWNVSLNYAKL